MRLCGPAAGSEAGALVDAALATGLPVDVTTSPALWGGQMRGTPTSLSCLSSSEYERAVDHRHAGDLIDANIFETLAGVGRTVIDFFFLRVRRDMEEFQLAGALEALEMARQDGLVRWIGVACDGPPSATLGVCRLHDAFEVLLAPSDALSQLAPLARRRRIGVISLGEAEVQIDVDVTLVSVSSVAEVTAAATANGAAP